MRSFVATAAAVTAALSVAPAAWGQAADTTSPVLTVGNDAVGARRSGPGIRSYGFAPIVDRRPATATGTPASPVTRSNVSATDNVGVTQACSTRTDNGANCDRPAGHRRLDRRRSPTTATNTAARARASTRPATSSSGTTAATVNGGLNQPPRRSAPPASGSPSTSGRAVGDKLVIDTSPAPTRRPRPHRGDPVARARPRRTPNITLSGAAPANAHAAGATVTAAPPRRTARSASRSTPSATDRDAPPRVRGQLPHQPQRRRDHADPHGPDPGLGQRRSALETYLDGVYNYSLPLDVSKLSLGKHTWSLRVSDGAGNGAADHVDLHGPRRPSRTSTSMITRYQTAGTIAAADARPRCTRRSPTRSRPTTAGDKLGAIAALSTFQGQAQLAGHQQRGARTFCSPTRRRHPSGARPRGSPRDRPRHHQAAAAGAPRHLFCAVGLRSATRTRRGRSWSSPTARPRARSATGDR